MLTLLSTREGLNPSRSAWFGRVSVKHETAAGSAPQQAYWEGTLPRHAPENVIFKAGTGYSEHTSKNTEEHGHQKTSVVGKVVKAC